jgi:tetratricopeptide (TPR) repeat protein
VKRAAAASLLLLVSLAIGYGYVVTGRETSHRQLIERGDAAMAEGDLATAIEAFSGAIALRGDSMIGYLKRGDAYRRREELEAALRDLRQAADLDPSATRPRELLGDVNYARNRFAPAIEHYEAYVRLDDSSPSVLYKLALARYRGGRTDGIEALEKALALDDGFAAAHYLLGLCRRDAKRSSEALMSLKRAITLAPAMLEAREELATLYEHLGRPDEWLAQLEVLRALDPGAARDVTLGLAYAKAGHSERAILTLRHAAERHPDHGYTYVALGRIWLEAAEARGDRVDLKKALEALEHAVAAGIRVPAHASEAYMLYGRALLLAFDNERAERMLQQATQKLPADPLAFHALAEAAERRAHFDVARQALLDYLALQGEIPDARRTAALATRVGDLSMRVADFPLAVSYYERAAPVLAFDAGFIVKFAEARWRAGQDAAARTMLIKLLESEPAHAAARALLQRIR